MKILAQWMTAALIMGMAMQAGAVDSQNDYPIQPALFTAVHVDDGFWSPRLETNRTVTLPYDFKKCEETGRIDNFAKAGGLMKGPFKGIRFDDSDVFKVVEGAAYTLALRPDPQLDQYLDKLIALFAAAQEDDGYLYTNRTIDPKHPAPDAGKERWSQIKDSHELYNVGHMYEAAVAHYLATGKRNFLDVAIKNADLIDRTFGPGKRYDVPGHEEIEIGLSKLYRVTGQEKYLKLAKFFIDERGHSEHHELYGEYAQDHKPVLEQEKAIGHSVRAGYLYSGMADIAALTGDPDYIKAIDRIWENTAFTKLYLTGGIGAQGGGEAFGEDYELPNASAYNETCAAIANALWNHRLFLLHGDAKYIDVLERVLYNGFLSGVSMTGDTFFYPNPLEAKDYERAPWFDCSCCPSNVVRFLPSIPGYVFAHRGNDIYVNLYMGCSGTIEMASNAVILTQKTTYPWNGRIEIIVEPKTEAEFGVLVRIPGWAQGKPVPGDLYRYLNPEGEEVTLSVNGYLVPLKLDKGFVRMHRVWRKGDRIVLELPMPVRRVLANEKVKEDIDRVAVERGPVLYCAEWLDNGGSVFDLVLPDGVELVANEKPYMLGGVTILQGKALSVSKEKDGKSRVQDKNLTLIPYYSWAHRGKGEMRVWLPRTTE